MIERITILRGFWKYNCRLWKFKSQKSFVKKEADLIPIDSDLVPENAKSLGGFVTNGIKAIAEITKLKPLVEGLGNNLFGRKVKVKGLSTIGGTLNPRKRC